MMFDFVEICKFISFWWDCMICMIIHRILIGHQHALLGVEKPAVDVAAVPGRGELRQRRKRRKCQLRERRPCRKAVKPKAWIIDDLSWT